jgi:hypothetical protein
MPQFGEANVGRLPEQLAALEGVDADDAVYKAPVTAASLEKGRTLIGKNAFGCISCHDMAGVPNSGTRGPDLAKTTQRVRYDWYRRWLEQPLRMQPGTRMPTVFLEGKSSLDTVLSGHADAQADAMWAYLALGPGLPLPDGLEPPKGLTLTVTERPVVLRTFMPEAGSRAFAVGYPGGVSVAFDAARCRLSYAWSGNFLDASPVWNDRGGSPAKPLGGRFLTMAAGCPVGVSVTSVPPDFGALARDPAYGAPAAEGKVYNGPRRLRFEGYRFTASGSPIFRYRIGAAEKESVVVEEEPEPLRSPVGVGLDRRFSLEMPSGVKPWLLAGESSRPPRVVDAVGNAVDLDWKGSPVEIATDRLLLLPQDGDRAIVLRAVAVPEGSRWYLHQCEGKWQVLLRGPLSAEPAKLKFNVHTWSLYRDEPALLKELLKR